MLGVKNFFSSFVFLAVIALCACGSKFVRKDDIHRISKDYEGIYVLKQTVEIGNFDSLNKGAKIRIYFKATGDYISIYAYPYSQVREEAVGKNIMQIFESDFPDGQFSEEKFREKLGSMVEPYQGKIDKLPTQNDFGSDLKKGYAPTPAKTSGGDSRGRGGRGGRGGQGRR